MLLDYRELRGYVPALALTSMLRHSKSPELTHSGLIVWSQIDCAVVIYQSELNSIQPAYTPKHVLYHQRIRKEVDH